MQYGTSKYPTSSFLCPKGRDVLLGSPEPSGTPGDKGDRRLSGNPGPKGMSVLSLIL